MLSLWLDLVCGHQRCISRKVMITHKLSKSKVIVSLSYWGLQAIDKVGIQFLFING